MIYPGTSVSRAIAYENNDIRCVYRSYRAGRILSRASALRVLLNRTVCRVRRE